MENEPVREKLSNPEYLVEVTKSFHARIRDDVREQLSRQSMEELSKVVGEGSGDVTYKIDAHAEAHIEEYAQELSRRTPLIICAEGFGRKYYGPGEEGSAEIEVIIDPIDGTRGIMYDLRSAWILTGIAIHVKEGSKLSDIEVAVQTEIPTSKQDKVSVMWAIKGGGAFEEIVDLRSGKVIQTRKLQTSTATELKHGFATFVDFFPGSKKEIAEVAEDVFEKVIGPVEKGKALVFDDQYISNAGQMYLLATGRYRFVADLRPEMEKILNTKGKQLGLASHPYDLSTALIADEAGAIITDINGNKLSYPLDTDTNCTWIGYSNDEIRKKVEPVLLAKMEELKG